MTQNNMEMLKPIIFNLYSKQGYSQKTIAEKLKINKSIINIYIHQWHLKSKTQLEDEKMLLMKDTIYQLYSKEGRSKNYLSKLFNYNRTKLTNLIDNVWKLPKPKPYYHATPSTRKFINKHRQFIKSKIDQDWSNKKIADALHITEIKLTRTIIYNDKILNNANKERNNRRHNKAKLYRQRLMDKSSRYYLTDKDNLPNEIWKPILGYKKYQVSNMGRVKKYYSRYKQYALMKISFNERTNREYVFLTDENSKHHGLQLARIVAFTFVNGHNKENNTVDHIDGNIHNNCATNLRWVSQSVNNKHAYELGRPKNRVYQKHGHFKYILVNNKYKFKTIGAFARFAKVHDTQAIRYIDGECHYKYPIKLIY